MLNPFNRWNCLGDHLVRLYFSKGKMETHLGLAHPASMTTEAIVTIATTTTSTSSTTYQEDPTRRCNRYSVFFVPFSNRK